MKRIFLISGFAQHGKDTTANFMIKYLDGSSLIIHNADSLKLYAKLYAGWNGEKNEKGRQVLQQLGTELSKIKLNKPFFWIEKTCDIIEMFSDQYDYFLVPDTRFISEVCYPQARFPNKITSINVRRFNNNEEPYDNGLTEEQKKHASETELIEFKRDFTFINEGNLDQYEQKVKTLTILLLENNFKLF